MTTIVEGPSLKETLNQSKRKERRYPKPEHLLARPFHLWNANEKTAVRWRYYSDSRRAHMGALYEARWARRIGTTIEVYNANTGRLLGQYTLRVNGIDFLGA
jgi:hypothetical protein